MQGDFTWEERFEGRINALKSAHECKIQIFLNRNEFLSCHLFLQLLFSEYHAGEAFKKRERENLHAKLLVCNCCINYDIFLLVQHLFKLSKHSKVIF